MRAAGVKPTLRSLATATERSAHSGLSVNVDQLVERGFAIRDEKDGTVELIRTIQEEIEGEALSMDPIVTFIDRYQKKNAAITPSYDEICDALDIASKSEVNRRVKNLIRNGHLEVPVTTRKGYLHRCLRVVKRESAARPGNVRDDEGKTRDADV